MPTPPPDPNLRDETSGALADRPAASVASAVQPATVSGPALPATDTLLPGATASQRKVALQKAGADELARSMPHNRNKGAEYDRASALAPPVGEHVEAEDEIVTASTVSEDADGDKLGDGTPLLGRNPNNGPLDRVRVDSAGRAITTNQGVPVADNQHSLKAGLRGPTLLEDFILREKITHFDHERIPERVVHARGSGAHGYFECYDSQADITQADLFSEAGKRTPVFVRFSTVAGERGSADAVRDTRGFAVKFYTEQGNWDLVGNNIPVFFIQDAMKFPDIVHAVKPEPHHGMPQASSAHDTFWDFISLMPESLHHTMWVMSDRGIPRSYRTMQGFGVNTYRFVNEQGVSHFVKFHLNPLAGTHSLVWDEAVKINGADPDFHRRDLWEAIESGAYPEYELAVQVFTEAQAERFSFDVLDATKIVPEELVPLRAVGRLVLDRNPDNFFAETEQVAFCVAHVVPGIDFSNDPLLQGRIHSYLDTQLSRLGGPNFHEIPINAPVAQVHNNQRDGMHRQAIHRGRVSYEPNSLAGGCPFQAGARGFVSVPEPMREDKVRGKPEKFADHYSQARLFWRSQTPVERQHMIDAFTFELSRVTVPAIRERMVSVLANVDATLADNVAQGLGFATPDPQPMAVPMDERSEVEVSAGLSLFARPGDGRVVGRRVALLVGPGVNGEVLADVQQALFDAGAVTRLVAPRLGAVPTSDGASLQADTTVAAMPSVLWDAVVLPDAAASQSLAQDPKVQEFVRDQYLHCKPILCVGALDAWAVAGLPSTPADPGLVCATHDSAAPSSGAPSDEWLHRFVTALARHRHFERESLPPASGDSSDSGGPSATPSPVSPA